VFCSFKQGSSGADFSRMTADSSASTPRFRSAHVDAPTTPEARVESLLADGEQLWAVYQDAVTDAAKAGEWTQVVRLAVAARGAEDPQRAYAAARLAAALLLAAAVQLPKDDTWVWAAPLDHAVELLVPVLELNPHEPALLDQLGEAVFLLGHSKLARRLFEAVRDIEPLHESAREHLRICKSRMQQGRELRVPEAHAPVLTRAHAHVKRIADRAVRLEDRTISVCMIVKDEEELLPGCLAAVTPFVDQVVVVDTGSSDRTREIATEFGATLVEFAWNGSFSDARNESLRHATGDWVLWVDADEHLVVEDGPQLRELARKTWIEGFHVIETHFMGGSELGTTASHAPMRLFQRRPEYRWHGIVHEQVAWALPTWLPDRMQHTNVRVDHYGYLAAVVADRDKQARNLELLMSQVEAGERTAFTCFNIGTEHGAMGDWTTARGWLEEALERARAVEHWQELPFAPLLVQRTSAARRSTRDEAGSIALVEEALGWWPEYTDLIFERACAHSALGQWDATIEQATRALAQGDAPARFVSISGKGSFQALQLRATALREAGRVEEAAADLEATIQQAPHLFAAAADLVELLLQLDYEPASVSARLDELLDGRAEGAGINLNIGAVLHEAGAFEVADARYRRGLATSPGHAATLANRAELRLAQRRLDEAYELGMSIDELDPIAHRGARSAWLAAASAASLDPERLAAAKQRIVDSASVPATERAMYAAWFARLQPADDNLVQLVPADDQARDALFANLEALIKLEATDAFEQLHALAEQVVPDERQRHMGFAALYLRSRFADMAGEELMACAQEHGADAEVLTGLGKVATMKELWEDAEVFLTESLQLDPRQPEAERLLVAVRERRAG
jgi:tetratricopeptide (TPR) repeat protein